MRIRNILWAVCLVLTVCLSSSPSLAQCDPEYFIEGEGPTDQFGASVSRIGDIDNDNLSDLVIGAFRYPGGTNAGKAYVFSSTSTIPKYVYTGANPGYELGMASGAGDVDGDGYDDIIISARPVSIVYVYSGRTGALIHTFHGSGYFGMSVGDAGDVNNDGFDDVIIGAWLAGGSNVGKAYVYSGSTGNLLYDWIGTVYDGRFGTSVDGIGDINNDGYDDVIVGAHLNGYGRAFIYSGADGSELFVFRGENLGDIFGADVSLAGDVNNDGTPDVIIGAQWNDAAGNNAGRAYVFSGIDGSTLHTFTGEAAGDRFGSSVAGLGDLDGDGHSELLVGAPWNSAVALKSGRAYLYSGRTGDLLATFDGSLPGETFGFAVSSAGDLNGGGLPDFVIGASASQNTSLPGRAYVYLSENCFCTSSGDIAGTVIEGASGIGGISIDLYDSFGSIISSTITDETGGYIFASLSDGDYTVSISTPIGYIADSENKAVSVSCGPATADFILTQLSIILNQRSRGYWKHEVSHVIKNIEKGKNEPTDYSAQDFIDFLALTGNHFVQNQINPIPIYNGSTSLTELDSLKLLKTILSAKNHDSNESYKKLRKGKAELMTLILNVVSGKISQAEVISVDGASVSHAVTYSWMLLNKTITCTDEEDDADNDVDEDECYCDYKKAEKILKKINHGKTVKSGIIPLDIQFIAYKNGVAPGSYSLDQNFPNPFNPVTKISYSIPFVSFVKLNIYNINGQLVTTLINGKQGAGDHSVQWDASELVSGVYLYKLEIGEFTESKKMVLLK